MINSQTVDTDIDFVRNYIEISENIDAEIVIPDPQSNSKSVPKTLARYCVENGSLDSLKLLIEHGSKPSFLIRNAVRSHQMECLKYLISQNFDINESTSSTASALYAAVTENLPEYALVLLENGADPTLPFKDQALLSYAAKVVSADFFKKLIEFGAPISALPPAVPPLIAALKKSQMHIVSLLLQVGADPDAHWYSKDSKITTYPLDIAFKNKSSTAMTLLLMTGARKTTINKDELDENIQKQFELFNAPIRVQDPQIKEALNLLFGKFRTTESSVKVLSDELRQVRTDFQSLDITPKLNRIRDCFEKYCNFIPNIFSFSKHLDDKRLPLLNQQFQIFEQDDCKKLSPAVKMDTERWRSVFSRTIELLEQNKMKGFLQKNAFIDFCNTELRKKAESFLEEAENVLCFDFDTVITDSQQLMKNREFLSYYVDVLQQYKALLKSMYDSVTLLHDSSMLFLKNAISYVNDMDKKLDRLSESETLFYRAGLPIVMIQEVQDSIKPKKDKVKGSLQILEEHQLMCDNLSKLLKKCVRQCVK